MNTPANSKEVILACALKFFSSRGYDGVSVSEITEAAGITKPTLYYFFGSKEGLFQALLETYYGELLTSLSEAAVYEPHSSSYFEDVFPVLKRIVRSYFSFARSNTEFYMMVLALSFSPPGAKQTELAMPFFVSQYRIVNDCFLAVSAVHGNLIGKETRLARQFIAVINAEIGFWHHNAAELDDDASSLLVHTFMHGIFA